MFYQWTWKMYVVMYESFLCLQCPDSNLRWIKMDLMVGSKWIYQIGFIDTSWRHAEPLNQKCSSKKWEWETKCGREGRHNQTVMGVVSRVLSAITNIQFSKVGIVHDNWMNEWITFVDENSDLNYELPSKNVKTCKSNQSVWYSYLYCIWITCLNVCLRNGNSFLS